jgi:preprotein translocase subunit SecA
MNFARRKNVLTYDDVMNQQRSIIYKQRGDVLCSDDIRETIKNMILTSVRETCEFCFGTEEKEHWKFDEFRNHYMGLLTDGDNFNYSADELAALDKDSLCERLSEKALEIYEAKDTLFASVEGMRPDAMREIEKVILLENVDKKWMEHLDNMEELKEYIGLNSYAQRDPVAMYRIQGADLFDTMIDDIKEDTVRKVLSVVPKVQKVERVQVATPLVEGFGDGKSVKRAPVKSSKVGRNDPCPCGSGQKYKKCCGRGSTEA